MEEENQPKSTGKKILSILILLFFVALLTTYWFFPFSELDFNFDNNYNFSISDETNDSNNTIGMQFYENMRFPLKDISYTIDKDCIFQKKQDMERAFEIIEEETILNFYKSDDGDIKIHCDEKNKIQEGLFIAGEGGPVNVTLGKNFNVIQGGQILLIKKSSCERPNIAIHELLHVLGFDHSENSKNIMYPVSKCRQIISEDMINQIDEIYSFPSLPDLEFKEINAKVKGRTLDLNISIRNEGLVDAGEFLILIYINDKKIKEITSKGIRIGYGEKIELTNFLVPNLKASEMKFFVKTSYEEISKENNEIILNVQDNL